MAGCDSSFQAQLKRSSAVLERFKTALANTSNDQKSLRRPEVPGLRDKLADCHVVANRDQAIQAIQQLSNFQAICENISQINLSARVSAVRELLVALPEVVFQQVEPVSPPPDGADIFLENGFIQSLSSLTIKQCAAGPLKRWLRLHLNRQRRALLDKYLAESTGQISQADEVRHAQLLCGVNSFLLGCLQDWRERRAELKSACEQKHLAEAQQAYAAWSRTIRQSQVTNKMVHRMAKATGLWGLGLSQMQRVFEEAGQQLPPGTHGCSGMLAVAARVPLGQLLTTRGQDIFNRFEDAESTRAFYDAVQRLAVAQQLTRDSRRQAAQDAQAKAQEQRLYIQRVKDIVCGLPDVWQRSLQAQLKLQSASQKPMARDTPQPKASAIRHYTVCILWLLLGIPHVQKMSDRWMRLASAVASLFAQTSQSSSQERAAQLDHNLKQHLIDSVLSTADIDVQITDQHEFQPSLQLLSQVSTHAARAQAIHDELARRAGETYAREGDHNTDIMLQDSLSTFRVGTEQLEAKKAEVVAALASLQAAADGTVQPYAITVKVSNILKQLFGSIGSMPPEALPPSEWRVACSEEVCLAGASRSRSLQSLQITHPYKEASNSITVRLLASSGQPADILRLPSMFGATVSQHQSAPFLLPSKAQTSCMMRTLTHFNKIIREMDEIESARARILATCTDHGKSLALIAPFVRDLMISNDSKAEDEIQCFTSWLVSALGWSLLALGVIKDETDLPAACTSMLDAFFATEPKGAAGVQLQQRLASAVKESAKKLEHLSVLERIHLATVDSAAAFASILQYPELKQRWLCDPSICSKLLNRHFSLKRATNKGLPFTLAQVQELRNACGAARLAQPDPPSRLKPTVDSIGETSARLSWTNPLSAQTPCLIHVQLRKDNALGPSFTNVYLGPDSTVLLNRLDVGQGYLVRMRQQLATQADEWGTWHSIHFHTLPAAPQRLALSRFHMHCGKAAFHVGIEGGIPEGATSVHLQMSTVKPSPWCEVSSRFSAAFPFETVSVAARAAFEIAWVPPGTQLSFRAQTISPQGAVSSWSAPLHVTVPLPAAKLRLSRCRFFWQPTVRLSAAAPQHISVLSGQMSTEVPPQSEAQTNVLIAAPKRSALHFEAPDVWFPRLLHIASGAGRFFYVNLRTNQSSFEPSQSAQQTAAQVRGSDARVSHAAAKSVRIQPQHPQWIVVWDPARAHPGEHQQAYYFFNTETQERSWERPCLPIDEEHEDGIVQSSTGDWAFGLHSEFVNSTAEQQEDTLQITSEPHHELFQQQRDPKKFVLAHDDLQLQATVLHPQLTQKLGALQQNCSAVLTFHNASGAKLERICTQSQQVDMPTVGAIEYVQVQYKVVVGEDEYISTPARLNLGKCPSA